MPDRRFKVKVSNIEELQSTTDGKPYWLISFEGKKMGFTDWDKPTYGVGDELPFELELVKPEGKKWYWKKKGVAAKSTPAKTEQSKQSKSYTADPQKIESIEYQNARNLAVEMYCHVTDQGTPPDYELLDTIFRHIHALGKDLVAVAKEQYGAVEK